MNPLNPVDQLTMATRVVHSVLSSHTAPLPVILHSTSLPLLFTRVWSFSLYLLSVPPCPVYPPHHSTKLTFVRREASMSGHFRCLTNSFLMVFRGPNGEQLAVDGTEFKWAEQGGGSVTVEGAVSVLTNLVLYKSSEVISELAHMGLGSVDEYLATPDMAGRYDEYCRVLALYSAYCTRVDEPRSQAEWFEALREIQGEAANEALLRTKLDVIEEKISENEDVGKQQFKYLKCKESDFGRSLEGDNVGEVRQQLDDEASARADLHAVLSDGHYVDCKVGEMPVYTDATPLSRVEWYADLLQRGESIEFTIVELLLYMYLVRTSTGSVASVCVYGPDPDHEPLPGSVYRPLNLLHTHSAAGATLTLSLFLNADHYDPLFRPDEEKVFDGGWTTVRPRGGGGHPQQPPQLRLLPVPPSGREQAELAARAFMSSRFKHVGPNMQHAGIVDRFLSKLSAKELLPASPSFILAAFWQFEHALLNASQEMLDEIEEGGMTSSRGGVTPVEEVIEEVAVDEVRNV